MSASQGEQGSAIRSTAIIWEILKEVKTDERIRFLEPIYMEVFKEFQEKANMPERKQK